MSSFEIPAGYTNIRRVSSFEELVTTRFGDGVNALCWERTLAGDFNEIMHLLGTHEGIDSLDENFLKRLRLGSEGAKAAEVMINDLRLLEEHGLSPVLDCIHSYPRDESPGAIPTDVYSFHADSAPVEASTYLCTYLGATSELLRNEEVQRRVDAPETRRALLKEYGGEDDDDFTTFLNDHCYDLHYAPLPGARPLGFGLGNLWRIAIEHPGCPVPPCIHRAPTTKPGEKRLLLIS